MSVARSWPIAAWVGVAVLAQRCAAPAHAQSSNSPPPSQLTRLLQGIVQAGQIDNVARQYGGTISWSWTEGRATELASVRVTAGVPECDGTHSSPPDVFYSLLGRGSLSMQLGLPGDKYEITVACPGMSGEINHASPMTTYKQPGGAVGLDRATERATLPQTLKGQWTGLFGTGTATMKWDLCLRCAPPPPAP